MDARAAGVALARIAVGNGSDKITPAQQVFDQCRDFTDFVNLESAAWAAVERFVSSPAALARARDVLAHELFPKWREWTLQRGRA